MNNIIKRLRGHKKRLFQLAADRLECQEMCIKILEHTLEEIAENHDGVCTPSGTTLQEMAKTGLKWFNELREADAENLTPSVSKCRSGGGSENRGEGLASGPSEKNQSGAIEGHQIPKEKR